jgi:hypothetical protein
VALFHTLFHIGASSLTNYHRKSSSARHCYRRVPNVVETHASPSFQRSNPNELRADLDELLSRGSLVRIQHGSFPINSLRRSFGRLLPFSRLGCG